jgi:hypothetical protein
MNQALPLELIRYRAWFETRDPWHLADYPGSAWRGAFGHAFKQSACSQPGTACPHCPEQRDCPYPPFFESGLGGEPTRPYLLEPQAYTGYFGPGTLIGLDFLLMGWANAWLALIIDTLTLLGQRGLGLRQPVRLVLAEIQQEIGPTGGVWASIHQSGRGAAIPLPIAPFAVPPAPPRAHLELLTPLKIKNRGALVAPSTCTAPDLLTALARRIEACAPLLPNLPLPPAPAIWLADAASLLEQAHLAWHDTHHYSSRQREALKMGGLMGDLILGGPALARAWPWLWLGQWLHLGSSTSIGFGRYRLQRLPER